MKKDTNKFLKLQRADASKIPLQQRKTKFIEIYQQLEASQATSQAERCLDCGNPYCQWKCPVHNYIPVWLKLAFAGRIEDAANLSHQTNSLPEICGRVCPQDRLCEGSCTLDNDFGAVTIGNVEKYITDKAFDIGWKFDYPQLAENAQQVAIVGSGPAGLACADVLIRNGIKAVVFERDSFIGGLLTYGIPAFKLEKEIVKRRHQILLDAGVEFRLNCEVGKDISLVELEQQFAAVFIATGTYQPVLDKSIIVDNNVLQALDYLAAVNQNILHNQPIEFEKVIAGKKVVVLGGGDTSMDCIRTSLRLGAKEITGVYRRSADEMPGSKREFVNATEEGALFEFNAQPVGLLYSNNQLSGVKFIKTHTVVQEDGKAILEHVSGSEFVIEADVVITAFGFTPEEAAWLDTLPRQHSGRLRLNNRDNQLVKEKIYAGGDIVRGASLVVYAVADGMKAGQEIADSLNHYVS